MSDPSSTSTYPKHIPSIPYSDSQDRLQTYDIWLPRPLEQSDPNNSIWIVYIHGGAWRDPTQDALCAEPTIQHLLSPSSSSPSSSSSSSSSSPTIAGIASLNYRLSPYPTHPTQPSTPSDPSRNVQHPTHIHDVTLAIQHLIHTRGITRWLGIGHSCGATLLLQHVSRIGLPTPSSPSEPSIPGPGPEALILLAGIYSLPLLLSSHLPPSCPPPISAIYRSLIAGAFSQDASTYLPASPVSGRYSSLVWPEGRLVILGYSGGDELVERGQRDVMVGVLEREGWAVVEGQGQDGHGNGNGDGERVVEVRDLKGGHDWVWEDGAQIAGLVREVVQRLGR